MNTRTKPEASPEQVRRFERKIHEVQKAMATLPGPEFYTDLLVSVRRAGWTTLAEGVFFDAVADSILAHARDLAQLQQRLKAAFEAVQRQ
jgi:hypothetical protein